MSARTLHVLPTAEAIGKAAAEQVAKIAADAIEKRGTFSIAFSGGSLPATFAKGIQEKDPRFANASKWNVFFIDERCVPHDHEDSNYRLCKDTVFKKLDIPAGQIFPIEGKLATKPEEAAVDYEKQLRSVLGKDVDASDVPVFDVLLLGIGPDGHCASLFPGHDLLKESKRLVASIVDSPKPPPQRITFTLPVLNAARHNIWICTGDGKKDAVRSILADPGSTLPGALVKPAQGETTWYLDDAAAALLPAPGSGSA